MGKSTEFAKSKCRVPFSYYAPHTSTFCKQCLAHIELKILILIFGVLLEDTSIDHTNDFPEDDL